MRNPDRDPVVVFDRNGTALVARNRRELSDEIEETDVTDGEYHGYSADGYALVFSSRDGRVVVGTSKDLVYDDAVAEITRAEPDLDANNADLRELLELLLKRNEERRLAGRAARRISGWLKSHWT
jgi:hypothetical protein